MVDRGLETDTKIQPQTAVTRAPRIAFLSMHPFFVATKPNFP